MKLPHRRQFLYLAAGAAALSVLPRIARAQAYPSRPVRIIVPNAAGGNNDIVARRIGQWLSERLGQPFVVENRPGAAGTIGHGGARESARRWLYVSPGRCDERDQRHALRQAKLQFHSRYRTGRGHQSRAPDYARETIGSGEDGPRVHRLCQGQSKQDQHGVLRHRKYHPFDRLFKMMAGVDMVHVPYRGTAPALNDLLGGQVQVTFGSVPSSIEHVRGGKLRALAMTTATRSEVLPDIPTMGDFLPGYEASNWLGIAAPRTTRRRDRRYAQ
jgi:tripartite-type tricarboxylate transporter receptor subunit TctC